MIRVQYLPDDRDLSREEFKRGINLLYVDLECRACGYSVTLAHHLSNGRDERVCPRCGDGKESA